MRGIDCIRELHDVRLLKPGHVDHLELVLDHHEALFLGLPDGQVAVELQKHRSAWNGEINAYPLRYTWLWRIVTYTCGQLLQSDAGTECSIRRTSMHCPDV